MRLDEKEMYINDMNAWMKEQEENNVTEDM